MGLCWVTQRAYVQKERHYVLQFDPVELGACLIYTVLLWLAFIC